MRYLNRSALGALTAIGLATSGAALAQRSPAGVPAVAPIGDAMPPPDMPAGAGPSGTSRMLAGPVRFDEVGYATISGDDAQGRIAAWGSGLPPSGFAEVTDLASGRTILVKTGTAPAAPSGFLVALSPGAARLLSLSGSAPAKVRVRQVEPTAADEVALEQHRPAALRLDAPPVLLTGLRAQMAQVPPPGSAHPPTPANTKTVGGPVPTPATHLNPPRSSAPAHTAAGASHPAPGASAKAPATKPALAKATPPAKPAAAATGRYHVQVAAFASQANARALAGRIHGHVAPSGKYWRVELGPFADAAAAKRARDGAAKRGYGDARVITD